MLKKKLKKYINEWMVEFRPLLSEYERVFYTVIIAILTASENRWASALISLTNLVFYILFTSLF